MEASKINDQHQSQVIDLVSDEEADIMPAEQSVKPLAAVDVVETSKNSNRHESQTMDLVSDREDDMMAANIGEWG